MSSLTSTTLKPSNYMIVHPIHFAPFRKRILPDCYSTFAHGRTRSHTVGHHHIDILLKNCHTWSNTVVHGHTHGRTQSHKIYSYSTRSHTVAQTTIHGRTWLHRPCKTWLNNLYKMLTYLILPIILRGRGVTRPIPHDIEEINAHRRTFHK